MADLNEEEMKEPADKPIGQCTLQEMEKRIKNEDLEDVGYTDLLDMKNQIKSAESISLKTDVIIPMMFLSSNLPMQHHLLCPQYNDGEFTLTYIINNMVLDSPSLFGIAIEFKENPYIPQGSKLFTTFAFPRKGEFMCTCDKSGPISCKMTARETIDATGKPKARQIVFKIRTNSAEATLTTAAA